MRGDGNGNVEVGVADAGAIIGAGGDSDIVFFPLVGERLGDAIDCFQKIDFDLIVGLGRGAAERRSAAKKTFENIKRIAAAKNIFKTSAALIGIGIRERTTPARGWSACGGGVAELVIHFSLFGVTKNLIGGTDFLEFLAGSCFFVSIGVVLQSKLAVGRFNLGFGSRFGDAQYFVIITLCRHKS